MWPSRSESRSTRWRAAPSPPPPCRGPSGLCSAGALAPERVTMLTMSEDLLKNLPAKRDVWLLYIDGEWTPAPDGGVRELIKPSNGELVAKVAEGTKAD